MSTQHYKNHTRYVPLYHFILLIIILAALAASVWNFYRAYNHGTGRLTAGLLFVLCLISIFLWNYSREFALRAQDRAIRAEESLRHFVLTGRPLDSRLRMGQVIALRFADDAEFVSLSQRAADENIPAPEIKKAIQNWKADHYRV